MNVELVVFEGLGKEIIRRVLAEEEPEDIRVWLRSQVERMGSGDDKALLSWEESFDYTDELLARFEARAKLPKDQRKLLDWPWRSWNTHIDPLQEGMLGVITAPDGMGKTMYAEKICEHWAKRRNQVVYVHYELNKALMMQRRLARHARVTVHDIQGGELTGEQRASIARVRPLLSSWEGRISYLHTPGWTMEKTIAELGKLHADGLCDGVVIDYLEKVSASAKQMKMRLEWFQREADNVEILKTFAESAGIPVVMVAQMRKDSKAKSGEDINRSMMRGAGEKSEKANLVVMLTRKREPKTGYSSEVEVIIDKNTMGRPGVSFKQYAQGEYFDVCDLDEEAGGTR